jgi:extracellular matrix protein 14
MEKDIKLVKLVISLTGQFPLPSSNSMLMCRAPGDAIDFAYGVADVRWSYSAELRDTGTVS